MTKQTLSGFIRYTIFLFFASGFMCTLGPNNVHAHPHVFIECEALIIFDNEGLKQIRQTWYFDEMFSSLIIGENDTNGDGKLSAPEIKKLKIAAFDYLKNYNYFSHLKINNKKTIVQDTYDFTAGIEDGVLYYTFSIDCPVVATQEKQTVVFSPFDPEYYADILIENKSVITFQHADNFQVQADVASNPKAIFSVYNAIPYELTLTFKNKP